MELKQGDYIIINDTHALYCNDGSGSVTIDVAEDDQYTVFCEFPIGDIVLIDLRNRVAGIYMYYATGKLGDGSE